jgi:hypothetical protein
MRVPRSEIRPLQAVVGRPTSEQSQSDDTDPMLGKTADTQPAIESPPTEGASVQCTRRHRDFLPNWAVKAECMDGHCSVTSGAQQLMRLYTNNDRPVDIISFASRRRQAVRHASNCTLICSLQRPTNRTS